MHTRTRSLHALSMVATGMLLALTLALLPARAGAQDMGTTPHPAHIHSGTCSALGDVVHPLADVGSSMATPMAGEMDMGSPMADDMAMGTPTTSMDMMASPEAMGSPSAMGGEKSVTVVQASLAELTAGGFAINVHESAENIGNYIACGDIGAMTGSDTDVTVELATLNDSGYSGTATLHENGDGSVTVTIDLTHTGR